MKNSTQKCSIQACLLMVIPCIVSPPLLSEVTLDGSMETAGSLNGPNYQITQALGQRTGNNLFHSFEQFNLTHTESATFSGSAGIENIIGRVTGGHTSSIDGLLRVMIPDANLYLLNPAGIMFGPNARLDVPGSFHASTADYLQFQEDVQFETGTTAANPILTASEPEAFGFLGNSPAEIALTGGNNTVLEVQNGEMISLLGGDITIKDASLYAPGGQINLASVGSLGNVVITETGLETTSIEQGRHINISQDLLIPLPPIVSGGVAANLDVSDDTAGAVYIRAGQLVMENASIASETKNTHGGNIVLDVGELKLTQGALIASGTRSSGNGGDLIVNAHTILLEGDGSEVVPQLIIFTTNDGDAGNITITADELSVNNQASITSFTSGEGDAGDLTIDDVNSLTVHDHAGINVFVTDAGNGEGGNLMVNAHSIDLYNGASIVNTTFGKGDTGDLSIISNTLDVRNGAIVTVLTSGQGDGGDLLVESNEMLLTNDELFLTNNPSLTGIRVNTVNTNPKTITGNSGSLTVKSHNLVVSNGASISTDNFSQGHGGDLFVEAKNIFLSGKTGTRKTGILSDTYGGKLGELTVHSDNLLIQNGAQISSQAKPGSTGNAGNITLRANHMEINGGAAVTTLTDSSGNAGDLVIDVDHLDMYDKASINASTLNTGDGGNIRVKANNIEMREKALIDASTLNEKDLHAGNGGNITISTNKIAMSNAQVGVTTQGTGQSGGLTITADDIILDNGALLHSGILLHESVISNQPDVVRSGNIVITFNDTFHIKNGSFITTVSTQPNAGNITIKDGNSLQLSNSNIITSVASGSGKGGDIYIDTPIVALDNSRIGATADEGRGGSINISGFLFQSPSSIISASSRKGVDGQVDLIPDTHISGSIGVLPGAFISTSNPLSDRCAARSGKTLSSFVVTGRGGIPVGPGDLVASNFLDYPSTGENPGEYYLPDGHSDALYSIGIDCSTH